MGRSVNVKNQICRGWHGYCDTVYCLALNTTLCLNNWDFSVPLSEAPACLLLLWWRSLVKAFYPSQWFEMQPSPLDCKAEMLWGNTPMQINSWRGRTEIFNNFLRIIGYSCRRPGVITAAALFLLSNWFVKARTGAVAVLGSALFTWGKSNHHLSGEFCLWLLWGSCSGAIVLQMKSVFLWDGRGENGLRLLLEYYWTHPKALFSVRWFSLWTLTVKLGSSLFFPHYSLFQYLEREEASKGKFET